MNLGGQQNTPRSYHKIASMDALRAEVEGLGKTATLNQSIGDVDKVLVQLLQARESIAADPASASITLAKLQNPVRKGLDTVTDDLKKVYAGHSKYGKVLEKNFSQKSLMSESLALDYNPMTTHTKELNESIVFHLLREGEFGVASIFQDEMQREPSQGSSPPGSPTTMTNLMLDQPGIFSMFKSMYQILDQIRARNLLPAIQWATERSEVLEQRDSTLEFDLMKLQYVWIFLGLQMNGMPNGGLYSALAYARRNFGRFSKRFSAEIQRLSAAVAFHSNIPGSPYGSTFDMADAFDQMAVAFTRDFCSLLGMSAESPLYIAVTAGAIALPTLEKMASIMKDKRTEWTTAHEMPVELPLPDSMTFHQIFVCPVSKEQATDANPPMRLDCGHVLAKESIQRVSKGGQKFKCPYCPAENNPRDAKEIYL